MRVDIATALQEMGPSFFRLPGTIFYYCIKLSSPYASLSFAGGNNLEVEHNPRRP